jgi:hypothetical protein
MLLVFTAKVRNRDRLAILALHMDLCWTSTNLHLSKIETNDGPI